MHSRTFVAKSLAKTLIGGRIDGDSDACVEEMLTHAYQLMGKRWRWLRPLAKRITEAFANQTRPTHRVVTKFILEDAGFQRAYAKHDLVVSDPLLVRPLIAPVAAASTWKVEGSLHTLGDLAEWLNVSVSELEWFSDLKGLNCHARASKLNHYCCRAHSKRFGRFRLIESPKPRLKQIQRQILKQMLSHVPPHDAAHGFRSGRSIKTFAEPHLQKAVVVKMDLHDFFPSIHFGRIRSLFRTIGYPEAVANQLTGLCTTVTPPDVIRDSTQDTSFARHAMGLYAKPHLPQGAPTSPAIANLCAYRMDCRLEGLAKAAGAAYTRYADDLVFSGNAEFRRSASLFSIHAATIIMEEGFTVHHRKTRIMRQAVQQRVAGLVVNQNLNLPRSDYDRLKAILTNCIRHRPETQNRENVPDFRRHLEGRVSYFESIHPARGERLRVLLKQVRW